MGRLAIILGTCYAVSLVALLVLGIVPGVPWQMLQSFVVHSVPLALVLANALIHIDQRILGRGRWALAPLAVAAGLVLVWFFNWTVQPFVIVPMVLYSVWQFVVGSAKAFVKPLALSILVMILGYGAIWNINYLAGHFLPDEALRDQILLDFDVALYRDVGGHDVGGQAGLYPVVREPMAIRFLEHAYMYYYEEIFLVLFVLLYQKADLTRFFSVMFGCFLFGIPIFFLYPAIGPCIYAAESIDPRWHDSNTWKLMKLMYDEWHALRSGQELRGFGYFIALPSMHVAVATILQVFAWRCRSVFWLLLPVNVLLYLSTFLLGYHYFLDVPAGLAVAGATLGAARGWDHWRDRSPSRPNNKAPRASTIHPQDVLQQPVENH